MVQNEEATASTCEDANPFKSRLKSVEAELNAYKQGYAELSEKYQKLFALYANNLNFYLGNTKQNQSN